MTQEGFDAETPLSPEIVAKIEDVVEEKVAEALGHPAAATAPGPPPPAPLPAPATIEPPGSIGPK